MAKDLFDFDVPVDNSSKLKKNDFTEQLKLANSLCVREQFDRAIKIFNDILDIDDQCEEAYVGLLRAHSKDFSVYDGEEIETDIRVIEKVFPDIINEQYLNYISFRNKNKKASPAKEDKKVVEVKPKEEKKPVAKKEPAKPKGEFANIKKGDFKALKKAIKGKKKIVLPDWVVDIPKGLFEGIIADELVIPDSVTGVDDGAFKDASIRKINIGANLQYLYDYFEETEEYPEEFVINKKNKWIKFVDNCLIYKNEDDIWQLILCYAEWGSTVRIPDGVQWIMSDCMVNQVKKVILPDSVFEIGHNAFKMQSQLESVVLPNSLEYLGCGTFSNCSHLKEINIPKLMKDIPYRAFQYCSNLEKINIPKSVKKIYRDAFEGCHKLVVTVEMAKPAVMPKDWETGWDKDVKEVKWRGY